MSANLSELFGILDALQQRVPLPDLKALLGGCGVGCEEVAHLLRFSAKTYQRIPLRGSDWYQAWVMCWRNGQRSPIHDHRGSSCGVRVLQGVLTETLFDFAANGHVKARGSHDFEPGDVIGGEDSDVHQVSNLQAASADLVTLHVYSPPLVFMGTYDMTSANRGLEPMMLEFNDAAGI
jgi:cysteine dioxygenase